MQIVQRRTLRMNGTVCMFKREKYGVNLMGLFKYCDKIYCILSLLAIKTLLLLIVLNKNDRSIKFSDFLGLVDIYLIWCE